MNENDIKNVMYNTTIWERKIILQTRNRTLEMAALG